MKTKFVFRDFYFLSIVLLLSSCAPTQFFQIYSVTSPNVVQKEDKYVYEDENCLLDYNLWGQCGNIGFKFYNKTSKPIFLDLSETHFVFNGIAHDYFLNRSYTSNSSVSSKEAPSFVSEAVISSVGTATSYTEQKIVCIPAKTAKIISEYNIVNSLYRDCSLKRYPNKKKPESISFSEDNSPIIFSNKISYTIANKENEKVRIENSFYVSEIKNIHQHLVIKEEKVKDCDNNDLSTPIFTQATPNKFYINYKEETNASQY